MQFEEVKTAVKAMIDYSGPAARLNSLEHLSKAVLLNSHTWERFFKEATITYPASSAEFDLDSTNAAKQIYKIVAVRQDTSTPLAEIDYITPGRYNHLMARNWNSVIYVYWWTIIGRGFRLVGQPASNTDITITYMRSPDKVGWGEIPADFLDYAAAILARMVTPMNSATGDGRPVTNPVYMNLKALEKDTFRKLIGIEYRQPGRDYKVRPDEMRVIRSEQFDY